MISDEGKGTGQEREGMEAKLKQFELQQLTQEALRWDFDRAVDAKAVGVLIGKIYDHLECVTIKVPPSPQEVLVRPDSNAVYVSCSSSHQIATIQIDDGSVKLIKAGRGADGLARGQSDFPPLSTLPRLANRPVQQGCPPGFREFDFHRTNRS